MRTLFFLLASTLVLARPAAAQHLKPIQVPAAVVAGFQRHFAGVGPVTWEKEGAGYEAGFTRDGVATSALLSPAGALLETETTIPPAQLPAPVQAQLARHYQGYRVTEAAKIVTAGTGALVYEAEVRQAGRTRDVLFRADGTEVRK